LSPQLKMLWIADSVPGGFKTIYNCIIPR